MSAVSSTPKKNLMLFSGRAHPELAEEVAEVRSPADFDDLIARAIARRNDSGDD